MRGTELFSVAVKLTNDRWPQRNFPISTAAAFNK